LDGAYVTSAFIKIAITGWGIWATADRGDLGAPFLYLEMLEQIEQTQGAGEYCKVVD
jgi:hypothetical protein